MLPLITPHCRLLVCVLTLVSCVASHAQQSGPPTVTVAKPLVQKITEWDEFTGRFVAKQRVDVRPRVSGFLDSVHFKEGQTVEKGQLLFVIDPRPFEAAVERAKAEVQRIATTLKVAQLEYERSKRLTSSDAMSREEMEERRSVRDARQARLEASRADLRVAELNLGFTQVQAPMTGRSSDIRVDIGNLVSGGNSGSTVLTTIVSVDPIELEFEGSEAEWLRYTRLDSSGARPSSRDAPNPVEARLSDEDDWVHKGVMTFVDNELDPDTATMRGRATFPNPDNLLVPGMFARIRLYGAGEYDAILVPEVAIVTDQALKLVMTVDEHNNVQPRSVELGPVIDGMQVIRKGLSAEDRVVVKGLLRARPGQPVTPEETTLSKAAN